MSDKEYFAVDAMSASMLKAGAVSMLYMKHRMTTPMTPSPAMERGTLGHMAVLEPDRFAELPIWDESKRTKAYKEFAAGVDGPIVSSADIEQYKAQRAQVMAHPEVQRLGLFNEGEPEAEVYWDEEGRKCKAKVDWLSSEGGYWIEYKTTADLAKCQYTFERMHYNLQVGWYNRGVATLGKPLTCYIVAQEQKAPFDVKVLKVSQVNCNRWFRDGMELYDKWLSGDRSGAYGELEEFELSTWVVGDEMDNQGIDEQLEAMMPEGVTV